MRTLHLLAGVVAFLPLLYLPRSLVYPFVSLKVFAFQASALALLAAAAARRPRALREAARRPGLLQRALWVFLATAVLGAIGGVDPGRSLWGSPSRMLGVVALAHGALLCFVLSAVFRETSDWRRLFWTALAAGSGAVAIGLAQKANPELLFNQGAIRVGSTLGHPMFLSRLGALTVCLSAVQAGISAGRRAHALCALAALLGAAGVVLGESRAAALALLVALAVFAPFAGRAAAKRRVTRRGAGIALAGLLLAGSAAGIAATRLPVSEMPVLRRFAAPGSDDRKSLGTRRLNLEVAVEAWRERPLFGWGPANYAYAFDRHYRPEFLRFYWDETWFDDAHNAPATLLVTQGALGLAAWLLLQGAAALALWRSRARLGPLAAAGAAAFLTVHWVEGLAGVADPVSFGWFFLAAAFLDAHSRAGGPPPPCEPAPPAAARRAVWAAALAAVVLLDVVPALAGHRLDRALALVSTGSRDAPRAWDRALATPTPYRADARAMLAGAARRALPAYLAAGRDAEARALALRAHEQLAAAIRERPREVRFRCLQGWLAQEIVAQFGDTRPLDDAAPVMEAALRMAPRRQEVLFTLSAIRGMRGDPAGAIRLLEQAIADAPGLGAGYVRLAEVYSRLGAHDRALEVLARAGKNRAAFHLRDDLLANEIRERAGIPLDSAQPSR